MRPGGGAVHAQGAEVILVVSAQGDTTDFLVRQASEVNPRGSLREMDALLAAGEQMSAALTAMAIGALGAPAVSLTGYQAGIHTDGVHGNAKILDLTGERIRPGTGSGENRRYGGLSGL